MHDYCLHQARQKSVGWVGIQSHPITFRMSKHQITKFENQQFKRSLKIQFTHRKKNKNKTSEHQKPSLRKPKPCIYYVEFKFSQNCNREALIGKLLPQSRPAAVFDLIYLCERKRVPETEQGRFVSSQFTPQFLEQFLLS